MLSVNYRLNKVSTPLDLTILRHFEHPERQELRSQKVIPEITRHQ